jgi:surfactin synthase thioesterase subunit
MGEFSLRPIQIPVSLVVSERTALQETRSGWMAWSLMARAGMTCQMLPGDHFTLLSGGGLKRVALRLAEDVDAVGGREAVAR